MKRRIDCATAATTALLVCLGLSGCAALPKPDPMRLDPAWTVVQGGVVRGDKTKRELALIFTGGEHGQGSEHILDTLADRGVRASFFVTGDFVAVPGYDRWLRRMVAEGHYLGPHSHAHLLYAPWEDRSVSLVTEQEFRQDLLENMQALRGYGADFGEPVYFIPPYEWYNAQHSAWSEDLGVRLFNFTIGSGSHRDWMPESHAKFRSSEQILQDILDCEGNDPDGLNGHLLLLHLGGLREDKMYLLLGRLIDELHTRGYTFRRADELLAPPRP